MRQKFITCAILALFLVVGAKTASADTQAVNLYNPSGNSVCGFLEYIGQDNQSRNQTGYSTAYPSTGSQTFYNSSQGISDCYDMLGGGTSWVHFEQYTNDFITLINYYFIVADLGSSPPVTSTVTRFVQITPTASTTVATTSSMGFNLYLNENDYKSGDRVKVHFSQDSAFACQNSGAVYDAVVTCSGANAPVSPFDYEFSDVNDLLLRGFNSTTTLITYPAGGKWTATFTIRQPQLFGLFYTNVLSSTTNFTVGQLSPMDIVRERVIAAQEEQASTTRHGIGAILASTTAALTTSCSPISGGFSLGDCLTLTIWPGSTALSEDFTILKQTPPWGYVFRVIDIFNDTEATTSLPTISYSFASTSPMSSVGNIHFDPFTSIAQSGDLINEMHSDQEGSPNVWQIIMPLFRIVMYLILFGLIIHDLTNIYQGSHPRDDDSKNN